MIVTRGFGEDGEIITRGFNTSIIAAVIDTVESARKLIAQGGSRAKKKIEEVYDEFIVKAALVSINGERIINPIWGSVTKACNESTETAVKVSDFAEVSVTKPAVKIVIDRFRILKD
ncbi:hypothetical protein OAA09_00780 [bacterium]|nr:hypothetical protein [bacterium]